jgi:putative FmdB family regulatory protein
MPQYEFRCESCEKSFETTLTITERANLEVKCPNCGSDKVAPSAHGLHSQDLAEGLKPKQGWIRCFNLEHAGNAPEGP